jgi:hypothetical protein
VCALPHHGNTAHRIRHRVASTSVALQHTRLTPPFPSLAVIPRHAMVYHVMPWCTTSCHGVPRHAMVYRRHAHFHPNKAFAYGGTSGSWPFAKSTRMPPKWFGVGLRLHDSIDPEVMYKYVEAIRRPGSLQGFQSVCFPAPHAMGPATLLLWFTQPSCYGSPQPSCF